MAPPADLALKLLAAIADPQAGAALYDMHDPAAPLLYAGRGVPAREVPRADYAAAHAHATGPTLTPLSAATDGDVVWVRLSDGLGDLALAVGGTENRVAWYALALAPEPWTFAEGRARMLAEFSFAPQTPTPRTWLDVAYHRLFGLPKPKLLALPEARFGCHHATVCCHIDFEISLPAAAQGFIDAVDWETVRPELAGTQLPPGKDGTLLLKRRDERCRFLDEQRHCTLHKAFGRAIFGPCAVFPYHFAPTPEGVVVTTLSLCGSVRAELGPPVTSRTADVLYRLALDAPRTPDAYRLSAREPVDWEVFRDAEAKVLALLDDATQPLERRLANGMDALAGPGEVSPEATAMARAAWKTLCAKVGLANDGPPPPFRPPDEAVAARMARRLVFGKTYAYLFDLVTAQNLIILVTLLARAELAAAPDDPVRPWQRLALAVEMAPEFTYMPLDHGWPDGPGGMADPAFGRALLGLTNGAEVEAQ